MKYVGMQTQIRRNNLYSALLLLSFPVILLGMVWVFLYAVNALEGDHYDAYGNVVQGVTLEEVNAYFLQAVPWVVGGVGLWFVIAYFANAQMIQRAVGARPLARRENPRVYNLVENLCIANGMDMPKINVVNDPQLNAFASGINKDSYTVTVTTGLLRVLDDEELEGVLAHELTHIRNRDTRLLITSIIFVGIISTLMSMLVRTLYYNFLFGGRRRSDDRNNSGGSALVVMLVALVCAAVAYVFTLLTRFAISRSREYMADAGGAQMSGNPRALASALRKISSNPGLASVDREDVAQLFIMRPDEMKQGVMSLIDGLFSTHPDPRKRIALLEQY